MNIIYRNAFKDLFDNPPEGPIYLDVSPILRRGGDLPLHLFDIVDGQIFVHIIRPYAIMVITDSSSEEAEKVVEYLVRTGTVTDSMSATQVLLDALEVCREV